MPGPLNPLLDRSFLQSEFAEEFRRFRNNGTEKALSERLRAWHSRTVRGETEIEAAFIGRFFEDTWGYRPDGHGPSFTLRQQFAVPGAGAGGASGSADLALGYFGEGGTNIAQVLCEFKGVGADLDRPQARKGSRRSPAEQSLDYLRFARRGLFDNAPVLPRYALVTDMNQFRLYWYDRAPNSAITFRIGARDDLFDSASLLGDSENDAFDRFLFWRLFQPDMLLSEYGRTRLERLIERQGASQHKLEKEFYEEYRAFRLRLYNLVRMQELGGASAREKLRVAQRLLDRFVFLMFSEDMGRRVAFPPRLLRDMLARESLDPFYDPESDRIWQNLRRLFETMNVGGPIGDDQIHRFNGGLFAADPLIDAISLPNHIFCARGQGRNDATLASEKSTLLYIAGSYDFSADAGGEANDAIGLYTLGHIFEQSIVELEVLEAEAEGRPSLSLITKRKRDGVYYTPEPIVRRIIDETLEPLLSRWKADAGWQDAIDPTRAAADAYWVKLRDIRIVDPACGSGAFLISAYRYLFDEMRLTADIRRRLRFDDVIEDAELTRWILATNIYGVDINPLSVEIAQLSLWLHSAYPREPLSRFDHTVRRGNSLVSESIYDRPGGDEIGEAARARIGAFEWDTAFPEIEARGGFDIVIGNPPYVKLQHFRRVYAETAAYLKDGVGGEIDYHSTQSGNFDLYLAFIERGLGLMRPGGRMGYIAPNLWPTLQYGEALRVMMASGRNLERWIDFRAHQVFEEATIYTAIQIYTADPNDAVRVAFARDGDLERIDWSVPDAVIRYDDLGDDGSPWLIAPGPVRALVERLARTCDRLDDPAVTDAIFQGLITSADYIFHLTRLADGRYLHTPRSENGVRPPSFEVAIEDTIMKPLVSGGEAKRFITPETETYLLFPYCVTEDGARLWTPNEMGAHFPRAWAYLHRFEAELRARESDKFDIPEWYQFGRSQNIDKQEQPKLFVAQTVPSMRVLYDENGVFYANNVRVNCILSDNSPWYLLGILNAPTTNMIFKWLGKPKVNDYYEANKQFIAPLPIPRAGAADRAEVVRLAQALQANTTRQAQLERALAERIAHVARRKRPYEWLLPDVQSLEQIEATITNQMETVRRKMADRQYDEQIEAALGRIDDAIRLDSRIEAVFVDGELKLLIDGTAVAGGIYLDEATGAFLLAQWLVVTLGFEPKGRDDGKKLIDALRNVGEQAAPALRDQIISRQQELEQTARAIRADEQALHDITARLFDLSTDERRLVEAG